MVTSGNAGAALESVPSAAVEGGSRREPMAMRGRRRTPYAREVCAAIYEERTGRLASDDGRLGWALAVRAAVREQALRAFANLARARPVAVGVEWPGWAGEGLSALSSAFEAYRAVDAGWGLLVDYSPSRRRSGSG
jgi:hypothetical protein